MKDTPKIDFNAEYRVAVCRPRGCFDAAAANWLVAYQLELESDEPQPFNRFIDLSWLDEIRLTGPEVVAIAEARREAMASRPPVRTAILAVTPFTYTIACLYEDLMVNSKVKVSVFRNLSDAASWLQVPRWVLEAP